MAENMSAANVQGFTKGDFIDRRREDSLIYYLYGLKSTLLCGLHSQEVGRLYLALAVQRSVAGQQRTPLKFSWPWR